jgi:hypothetical protein
METIPPIDESMTKIKKLTGSSPGGKLPVVAGGQAPAGLLLARAGADLGGERDGGVWYEVGTILRKM